MKFKDTPFGKIPESWRLVPMSEVTELVTDYVANGSFASLAENVTYKDTEDVAVLIRLVDYNSDFKGKFVFIDEHAYEFLGKSKLYGDEIIISNVGANVGTVFRCPHLPYKMSLAPNTIMVKFKESDDFYYFWLRSHAGQHMLHSIVTGSAQPKFNKTNFKDMLVPVPPRDQQDKIVSILQPLEDKIEQNKKINENLDQQGQALVKKYCDLNPSKALLGSIMTFANGFAFQSSSYLPYGTYKIITIKNVQDGKIDSQGSAYINDIPPRMKSECLLHIGDVLLSLTGNVGRVGIVCEDNLLLNQRVAKLVPNDLDLLPYLYFYFRLPESKTSLETIAKGTAQQNLSPIETLKMDISYDKMVRELSQSLLPMFRCIIANQEQNQRLSDLRDTLLPRLMSGELDVSGLDL